MRLDLTNTIAFQAMLLPDETRLAGWSALVQALHVQAPVREILSGLDNLTLLEPLDYLSLVQLLKRSYLVLTDSGGIQEEAPSFNVPVLVMRETTERPEGVDAGMVRLVGVSRERIVSEAERVLCNPEAHAQMAKEK